MKCCNICGGDTILIQVKEQMLGLGEVFDYNKCIDCGHAHLENIPDNMGKYYDPKEYYSFNKKHIFLFKSAALKSFLPLRIDKEASILDYGCGAGQFVKELSWHGWVNAKGYDVYFPDTVFPDGEITNTLDVFRYWKWDVITLNHTFEHLNDPVETLQYLRSKLKGDGILLLRIPVIDSYAFEKYRENWVQFDAPRHVNLFTRESIKMIIENVGGFKITAMHDDSTHFQFTGSDLYKKGKSLRENSFIKRLLSIKSYYYHFLAKKLNKQNKGDQVIAILQKS